MKTKWYGIAGVAVLALSLSSAALAVDLGVFGSYIDSDDMDEGYGAGAKLKIIDADFFALDIRGSWVDFSDTEVSIIPVEASVLLQLPLGDTLNLYGGAGAGYYFFDADDVELDDSVGYYPIAGLEIALGNIKLFGEVRWLLLSADVDAAGDELEGLVEGDEAEVDGLGVNVGLLIDL